MDSVRFGAKMFWKISSEDNFGELFAVEKIDGKVFAWIISDGFYLLGEI